MACLERLLGESLLSLELGSDEVQMLCNCFQISVNYLNINFYILVCLSQELVTYKDKKSSKNIILASFTALYSGG